MLQEVHEGKEGYGGASKQSEAGKLLECSME
jgi:hypothetical protein